MARRHRKYPSVVSSTTASAVSSVVSSRMPSAAPSRAPSPPPPTPAEPFRLMDLPSELRLRIYEMILGMPKPLDLDPTNHRLLLPRLAIFLACRQVHEEAYRVFYAQTIRLFPMNGKFFYRDPLLTRLPRHYRNAVTTVELRLGPGWSKPPRCQNTRTPSLGLTDCINLRTLKIFVECDPSDSIFMGFRGDNSTEDTYKWFCVDLLSGLLDRVPNLETVEIDAYPAVQKEGPMIMALRRTLADYKKKLVWGPLRGWDKDADEPGLIGLEKALAGLALSDGACSMQNMLIAAEA